MNHNYLDAMITQIKQLLFPQNTRKFSARIQKQERILRWALLIGFFSLNLTFIRMQNSLYEAHVQRVLAHPFDAFEHMSLAIVLKDIGFIGEAKSELVFANQLSPLASRTRTDSTKSVLGTSTVTTDLLTTWDHEEKDRETAYRFWQTVTQTNPEYRDGFLWAGTSAWNVSQKEKAVKFFEKAEEIDPNYRLTTFLLENLKQQ